MEVRYTRNEEDGIDLAYATIGEGPIDLVVVPGFVNHLELVWEHARCRHLLDRLSSFARVILWDKREQGLSGRTGRAPTLEQSKDDLLAVLAAAGSERTAMFGISEGGPMSILFAASHPDRVRALALYGTYVRLVGADDFPAGVSGERLSAFIDRISENYGTVSGLRAFAPSAHEDPNLRELWPRIMRSGSTPQGLRDLMDLYRRIDLREVAPSVHAPALVLHPHDDLLVPMRLGRDLAERLPNAKLVELPGPDHLWFGGEPSRVDLLADELEEFLTGGRQQRGVERVLTTVLFTDIVGSTERAAELGDRRWREVLESHHALVREQFERFGGREVGTVGDGFIASFDGPARAVRCADAIIDRTAERSIPIRAGVHTGECELIDGDLAGLAVHIGARIGAIAGSGEVLVSGTVRDLVVGSELEFRERGEHELRGVPGSWRIFELAGSGVPA